MIKARPIERWEDAFDFAQEECVRAGEAADDQDFVTARTLLDSAMTANALARRLRETTP